MTKPNQPKNPHFFTIINSKLSQQKKTIKTLSAINEAITQQLIPSPSITATANSTVTCLDAIIKKRVHNTRRQ
jgi:hypothetical protein